MNDLDFLAGRDWRGEHVAPGEVPSLSHFVERALQREAGADDARRAALLAAWAREGWSAARMARELGTVTPDTPERVAAELRALRRRVIASLVVRDATGACGLPEVVSTTTALAELAIQRAVAIHARELAAVHGVPTSESGVPQDLLVVGMGKLGGGELNVSSDIDLIFVYDEDGETRPLPGGGAIRPLSNHEFFIRLGRRVIPAISDVTADGYVFRVDMRLRPNGDAGPLAVSSAMLEEYLMVQGREWERFAWQKGRIVSAPVFAPREQFDRQAQSIADVVRP
ncbi:MAG TPA: bifunctional [glutamate--ammonia ligase]-adenylyl-L-tyrosine phosphorylase/[glutamate--ammonia-ligase] adenylyltransferase, partial [Burkholderiaceae bacterium]|nr:bifunctional [glutamate--ammonia ligase]-adenylyl-L-tyrosine phosphorylase/[glutamate--ammonia-ligase] adenylyltransferase [Burkholderiaceae bacterium]